MTESMKNVQTGLARSDNDAFLVYNSSSCEESYEVDAILHKEVITVYCDVCERIHSFKLADNDT